MGWRVELFDIPRARGERKVERSVHRGCRVSAYQRGCRVSERSVSVPINKGTQPTNEHEEACLKVRVPGACDISPMQGRSFTGRGRCAGQILMDAGARCASTSCAWHQ